MKFSDNNFEEQFMNWLNSKTVKELVESLKKYSIQSDMYSYEISNKIFVEEYNFAEEYNYSEININNDNILNDEQYSFDENCLPLSKVSIKNKNNLENISLEDAA